MDCLGGGVRRACAAACSNIDRQTCQQSSHSCGQISPPPEEMGFHPRNTSPGYVVESWRDGGRRFRLLDQRFQGQIVQSFLHPIAQPNDIALKQILLMFRGIPLLRSAINVRAAAVNNSGPSYPATWSL